MPKDSNRSAMSRSQYVAESLKDSFWKSNVTPQVIYGIRLYNETPLTNFDYPYQLLVTTYEPTYGFYANSIQDRGGVAVNGTIVYQYDTQTGWKGTLRNKNTIEWKGEMRLNPGTVMTTPVWTRVYPSLNTQSDQLSPSNIWSESSLLTDRSWNQQALAYPQIYKNIRL